MHVKTATYNADEIVNGKPSKRGQHEVPTIEAITKHEKHEIFNLIFLFILFVQVFLKMSKFSI